jgi:hypothetical protein
MSGPPAPPNGAVVRIDLQCRVSTPATDLVGRQGAQRLRRGERGTGQHVTDVGSLWESRELPGDQEPAGIECRPVQVRAVQAAAAAGNDQGADDPDAIPDPRRQVRDPVVNEQADDLGRWYDRVREEYEFGLPIADQPARSGRRIDGADGFGRRGWPTSASV